MSRLELASISSLSPLLAEGGDAGQPGAGGSTLFIGLILAMLVFWVITFRGSQKDKKKRQQMLDAMAKNDKVLTIGGIIGTVVLVKDNEVVVKVDETNNTKITFARSAIQKIITEEDEKAPEKK